MHLLSSREERTHAWLSLTPEPERELPDLLASLTDSSVDFGATVRRETDLITGLVLRGTSRRWARYLDRVAAIALEVAADGYRGDRDPVATLEVARIVLEHDRMLIGLPGPAYDRAAGRRKALARAVEALERRTAR